MNSNYREILSVKYEEEERWSKHFVIWVVSLKLGSWANKGLC